MSKPVHSYIYLITSLIDGRIYVGKKCLNYTVKKKLSKKARALPENKRKRVVKVSVSGGWDTYMGSSEELKEDIKTHGLHNFKKQILQEVYSKAEATYFEVVWMVKYRVLEKDVPSYNKWLSAKVCKSRL